MEFNFQYGKGWKFAVTPRTMLAVLATIVVLLKPDQFASWKSMIDSALAAF